MLKGDTVTYAAWNSIKDTLDYDFATEKQFSYEGLSVDASVKHLAKFVSDIWQIHPFCEGNTRATAVFMIKYMKTFGFREVAELLVLVVWLQNGYDILFLFSNPGINNTFVNLIHYHAGKHS